jgi:predicted SnoaL-like aldol condensation-catalyzing enzyme
MALETAWEPICLESFEEHNKKEITMSHVQLEDAVQQENAVQHEVVLAVLTHLQKGDINEATAYFAESCRFNDHGIELQFTDSSRLADFFKKARELYPESSLRTDNVLVSGDYVTIQWMRHTVLTEPFFGGLSRKVPISLHGASIVRIEDGRVTEWSDYYDGLKSRRTALADYFTEWVEL